MTEDIFPKYTKRPPLFLKERHPGSYVMTGLKACPECIDFIRYAMVKISNSTFKQDTWLFMNMFVPEKCNYSNVFSSIIDTYCGKGRTELDYWHLRDFLHMTIEGELVMVSNVTEVGYDPQEYGRKCRSRLAAMAKRILKEAKPGAEYVVPDEELMEPWCKDERGFMFRKLTAFYSQLKDRCELLKFKVNDLKLMIKVLNGDKSEECQKFLPQCGVSPFLPQMINQFFSMMSELDDKKSKEASDMNEKLEQQRSEILKNMQKDRNRELKQAAENFMQEFRDKTENHDRHMLDCAYSDLLSIYGLS